MKASCLFHHNFAFFAKTVKLRSVSNTVLDLQNFPAVSNWEGRHRETAPKLLFGKRVSFFIFDFFSLVFYKYKQELHP